MLSYGTSKVWTEQLKEFTNDSTYNASALLEYYQPLLDYLTDFNRKNNVNVGWEETACPTAPDFNYDDDDDDDDNKKEWRMST